MSRDTIRHYHQTNNCPDCGKHITHRIYGSITSYWCVDIAGCGWSLDWRTKRLIDEPIYDDEEEM